MVSHATSLPIVALCTCFCATVLAQEKHPVSFEDALLQRYAAESFNGTWISENEYIYEDDSVIKYNVDTKEYSILLDRTAYHKLNMSDVTVSADGKWIAVEYDQQFIFRHSATCLYKLIELETRKEYDLAGGERVQLLVWAPVGSALVYIRNNDVFYQDENDRLNRTSRQITNTDRDVYNGVADWVYEEEVLEGTKALWFSPNGTKLVFATMNDTNVRNVTFWKYGDPGNLNSQYVQEFVIKYPKVGTVNPVAYLNYVELKSETLTPKIFKAPEELVTRDNILGSVSWVNEFHFSMTWMERLQTKGFTLVCSGTHTNSCTVVYSYTEPKGWLTIEDPLWTNSSAFLTILPQDQGPGHGNYRHLTVVRNGTATPLTSGLDTVLSIDCYDKSHNTVFYTSTVRGDSAKRLIYKMDLNNPNSKDCFSCRVDANCSFGVGKFSKNCANAVLSCKGPSVPKYNIYNKDGEVVQHLSNNTELSEALATLEAPTRMDLTVPVPGGFTARVRLLLPPNMDGSGNTKYPVLFYVYSGPDTNKVLDGWSAPAWDDYMVTRRGVVIAYLDGRGSGLRGDNLKFAIYHRLGGPEIEDILIVGQHLQEKFPFVDPLRMGIWGWSYGGFATAMTLAKDDKNIFRCGISVAPVTNWIYYDTVYTERYMGLPTNVSNLAGYEASDVSAHVENFRHKLFYLIHGNADDNVHYQQSMMLSRALELADIMFFQQSYPDEAHGLNHVRRHLYHSMDMFWTRCFHLNSSDYMEPDRPNDVSGEYSVFYE